MPQDINEKVKKIIVEHLAVPYEKVEDTASFSEDLGADSLDAMDLLMAVNEEFNIRIPPEQMDFILLVRDLTDRVKKELDEK